MVPHRIEQLRKSKGWSQERLGAAIGRTKGVISRLETGETKLDIEVAQRIATALNVTLPEVLGIEIAVKGRAEDAVEIKPAAGSHLAAILDEHRLLFRAETDALDLAGVPRGATLLVNEAATAVANPRPLQIVAVMYHPTGNGKALHLLRQFVPPRLLITNSSFGNERPIDMVIEHATVIGVVEQIILPH